MEKWDLTRAERYYFLVSQRWIKSPSPFESISIRARELGVQTTGTPVERKQDDVMTWQ